MLEKKQRALKHFFYSNIFLAVVLVVLIVVGFNVVRIHYQNQQVSDEIARLESESKKLESRRLETLDALRFADSQAFVEQKARLQFNLVRPGESVAIVPTSNEVSQNTMFSDHSEASLLSNPQKWRNIFFKK